MSIQKLREFEVAVELQLSKEEIKLSRIMRLVEDIKGLLDDEDYKPRNVIQVEIPLGIDSVAVGALVEEFTYEQWEKQGLSVTRPTPTSKITYTEELKATEMVDLGGELAELKELEVC